jgi:hypothetical protein
MNFNRWTNDELASYLSDFYKDIYGVRPRHIDFQNRELVIQEIKTLETWLFREMETPEGRSRLEDDGWALSN